DYVDLTNVMEALRFMATETDVLSTDDIIPAVRKILDNSEHADIVIEDLARWGDWSVMEKLVERFKSVNEEDTWQRVPILSYLLECPKPEAKEYIKELKKIDPQSFERASFYRNIGDIDDDDDWGDGDVPVANQPPPVDADSNQESKENASKDEDDDSPTTMPATDDTSAAPIAPTIFRDDQVKTAAAEVDLVIDDVDATKKQIELTRVSQTSHLLDEPEPFVETELADVLMVNPKATADAPPEAIARDDSTENSSAATRLPQDKQTSSAADQRRDRSVQVAAASIPSAQQDTNSSSTSWISTLKVILIPMAASLLILGLMWSVVNGWFERLIF
ncbi:hypothetical protein N9Y42_09290, partial [Mariniblastus sp.]|nr:hypothetical protein [Mariniblastus sp.]